jgi:hypothetical protein
MRSTLNRTVSKLITKYTVISAEVHDSNDFSDFINNNLSFFTNFVWKNTVFLHFNI